MVWFTYVSTYTVVHFVNFMILGIAVILFSQFSNCCFFFVFFVTDRAQHLVFLSPKQPYIFYHFLINVCFLVCIHFYLNDNKGIVTSITTLHSDRSHNVCTIHDNDTITYLSYH